jgi:hypothetical protein
MEVRNDPNVGPYGPFKASEIVLYDSEALNARSTAAALREAQKHQLAAYVGHGLWAATHFALNHVSDFEERYMRRHSRGERRCLSARTPRSLAATSSSPLVYGLSENGS